MKYDLEAVVRSACHTVHLMYGHKHWHDVMHLPNAFVWPAAIFGLASLACGSELACPALNAHMSGCRLSHVLPPDIDSCHAYRALTIDDLL